LDPKDLHRKVAIVGVAESDIGRVPHKSKFQLSAEASKKALDEAGLTKDDVDGVFTTIITDGGQFSSMMMAEYMGITPRYTDSTDLPLFSVPLVSRACSSCVCHHSAA
jgi:acetyl-CoA acetyltransferase